MNNRSIDFQKIETQYLALLEDNQQKQKQKISQLRQIIHRSASRIQIFWKKKNNEYKIKSSVKIQNWWKKIRARLACYYKILNTFKRTYYKGVFVQSVRKYVLCKLKRTSHKPIIKFTKIPSISSKLLPLIKTTLIFRNSLNSQMQYMQNLRYYNELKFRKKWQSYEQSLRTFIENHIKRKWIKDKNNYLDEKGKQRNKKQFIQSQIEKLYDKKFDQFQSRQEELLKAILHLKQTQKGIQQRYNNQIYQMILKIIKF